MTQPTTDRAWPRAYLLQLYTQAIEQGCIRVGPIEQGSAKSLLQSFYRLRRRADKANAHFIQPEFELVTGTSWSPEHGGSFYLMYSALPEGMSLPSITAVDSHEALAVPAKAEPEILAENSLDLIKVEDINVGDYLAALRQSAAESDDDEASEL